MTNTKHQSPQPSEILVGRKSPDIDLSKTALIIVDMQYSCASRYYGLGKWLNSWSEDLCSQYFNQIEDVVVPNIAELLKCFRSRNLKIIYLTIGAELPDFSDLPKNHQTWGSGKTTDDTITRRAYHTGEIEYSILDELAPTDNELVIPKRTTGAFNSSPIDMILRNMGIDTLVFTGVATDGCVLSTAIVAADLGYQCILVDDACAANNPMTAGHDVALRVLTGIPSFACWTMSTKTVVGNIDSQRLRGSVSVAR